jgi:hypothetical protein
MNNQQKTERKPLQCRKWPFATSLVDTIINFLKTFKKNLGELNPPSPTPDDATTWLNKLNHIHPHIKSVSQIGISISFLAVFIKNDNRILFASVYHKNAAEPYLS